MRKIAVVALLTGAALWASVAWSGSTPENVQVYRQTVMEGLGKHMKALGMITKGDVDRPADALAHAIALQEAGRDLPGLFPAGTGPSAAPKTEALDTIWSKPDDFAKAAKGYQNATAKLVEVAKGTDMEAIKAQYGKVRRSCSVCHETFRKDGKKDEQ